MNFLEKNLEDIIWENYERCVERGLWIGNIYHYGKRFRQMNLMPYGIADLVNVYYNPVENIVHFQVIECKRGKIDAQTYLQAKRYLTALRDIYATMDLVNDAEFVGSCVLIGASVDANSELAHAIYQDKWCSSFVYKYGVDGIRFEDSTIHWWAECSYAGTDKEARDTHGLGRYMLDERYALYNLVKYEGDYRLPLLVTPEGVLVNTSLLEE